jgi:hypothetical protein
MFKFYFIWRRWRIGDANKIKFGNIDVSKLKFF